MYVALDELVDALACIEQVDDVDLVVVLLGACHVALHLPTLGEGVVYDDKARSVSHGEVRRLLAALVDLLQSGVVKHVLVARHEEVVCRNAERSSLQPRQFVGQRSLPASG
mgnify:CR=1 FL=1